MIDFNNSAFFKLKKVANSTMANAVSGILIPGENIIGTYKGVRDYVVFTDKRVISVNVQGLTGKKVEIYSLPYSAINMWSSENAGKFLDWNAEIELWTRAGHIKINVGKGCDVRAIDMLIANAVVG